MPRTKQFDEKEVLNKAMELFWKKGYHDTSMQDLVDHLGISRASMYDTYGGKKELFEKAFRLYQQNNQRATLDFLNRYENVKEGFLGLLTQTIAHSIEGGQSRGCMVVNTATEMLPANDPEVKKLVWETTQHFEQLFYDYLKAGEKRGALPPGKDLKALAAFIFTLYSGTMVLAKMNPDREKLLATVREGLKVLD